MYNLDSNSRIFWRENIGKVVYLIVFAILDVLVNTIFLLRCNFVPFHAEYFVSVDGYTYSLIDVWVLSVLRSVLLLGSLFGVLYNYEDGLVRVKALNYAVILLCVLMWSYPQIKMLIYTENAVDFEAKWFWLFFVWSEICAWIFLGNWYLLCSFKLHNSNSKNVGINSSEEERQCLLQKDNDIKTKDTNEEQTAVNVKIKAANIFRLLSMSKPDIAFIILASFFMVASSVCMLLVFIMRDILSNYDM